MKEISKLKKLVEDLKNQVKGIGEINKRLFSAVSELAQRIKNTEKAISQSKSILNVPGQRIDITEKDFSRLIDNV